MSSDDFERGRLIGWVKGLADGKVDERERCLRLIDALTTRYRDRPHTAEYRNDDIAEMLDHLRQRVRDGWN